MSQKLSDNSLLIHRPKKRRNYLADQKSGQKSSNLKLLHQTLLCEESNHKQGAPERSSVARILASNRYSRKEIQEQRESKDKPNRPVNFYINIEKLRNLKISNDQRRTQEKKRIDSSPLVNPYLRRDRSQLDRRSQLLKDYANRLPKKGYAASRHATSLHDKHNASISRLACERVQDKSKARYKTYGDEDVTPVNRKPAFKRAHNQAILKDKTFIEGYLRGKQLGRGGFSKVWEGFHFKTKKFYAVKEIDTTNKYQTHLTEIWFGNFFFDNGEPKTQFSEHPGIKNLLKMYAYSIVDPRAFIVFESCQGSLGNMLYDIYEEDREDDIPEDDKLYMIKYKPLYNDLRKSSAFIRLMLLEVAQALDLLTQNRIVHSDIKTENILMKTSEEGCRFKLIDYGSSFVFESLKQYKLATPEYMCPELLNYILYENKKPCREDMLEWVKDYENTSAIDVWGLGCILIELIHGLPLWLSNKTKIQVNGRYQTKRGLFAVGDRSFARILQRQLNVINNFDIFLRKENNSGMALDKNLTAIIREMLQPNPAHRIRPSQIIQALKQPYE